MADIALQADEFALHILSEELNRRNTYKWKTASGEVIDVKDMTTTHLKNAIRKLKDHLSEQEILREAYCDYMAEDY